MNKTAAADCEPADCTTRTQPARESNIDAIVDFFKSGIKEPNGSADLGIELEHVIVRDSFQPVAYRGDYGVAWLLDKLSSAYPNITTDGNGDLLGVSRPGEAVTIEPAAQLELSAGPFASLDAAQKSFDAFEKLVADTLAPVGEQMLFTGYHPTATARSLELIPKRRYQFMDLYLGAKDIYGPCMMRGSASTQISIDYTSVSDCLRKLRLAFALVPIFSLICDNTPFFEGEPRKHKLVRTAIWQHVDNDRCGLVPGALDPAFNLRDYAAYLLDAPAILAPCAKEEWCYSERTFGDLYADRTMTRAEVEHATSMFFTDVRLKTYIEIRPADAMPIPYVMAYAALIKGLFYAPENLDALDDLFIGVQAASYESAKNALMEHGFDAIVYNRPIGELCDRIMELGARGLADDERDYLEPLARLVEKRVTLADLQEHAE